MPRRHVGVMSRVLVLFWLAACGRGASARATPVRRRQVAARETIRARRQEIAARLQARGHPPEETTRPWKTRRRLQDDDVTMELNDPCAAAAGADVFSYNGRFAWSPSYWQACAESLPVDAQNMILHIESLDQLFRDYHVFYDTLKDPENSDPAEFQPQFGNTILGLGDDGVIDMQAEFARIVDEILSDGSASLATFWDVERIIYQLRDGHISSPDHEGSFPDYFLAVMPARFTGLADTLVRPKAVYVLDPQGELQLTLDYRFVNATTLQDITTSSFEVATVNGQTVSQFVTGLLTNNPDAPGPDPTIGARVNEFTANGLLFDTEYPYPFQANPTGLVPDFFVVTYTDGTSDDFATAVVPFLLREIGVEYAEDEGGQGYILFDREFALAYINQPGDQYDAYARSLALLPPDFGEPARKLKEDKKKKRKRPKEARRLDLTFNDTVEDYVKVTDDGVMVFKIPTFSVDAVFDDEVVNLLRDVWPGIWSQALQTANEGGYKKLLIDLSRNPGGSVYFAYIVIMSLFPEVSREWMFLRTEITWNDSMEAWVDSGKALVDLLLAEFDFLTTEEIEARISTITDDDIQNYRLAISGMTELCLDGPGPLNPPGACPDLGDLNDLLEAFAVQRDVESLGDFVVQLFFTITYYTPWNAMDYVGSSTIENLQGAGKVTRLRGGVEYNSTVLNESPAGDVQFELLYELIQNVTADAGGNPFDEYVFVSGGLAASSSALVSQLSSQIYKNRELTGTFRKVSLVSYGGTGNPDDITFASVPAGVSGINLERPIIGDALIQLFIDLLPPEIGDLDAIYAESLEYSSTVAIPPYFADTQPKMPVAAVYDPTMGPDAFPLQLIRIPLDGYIPRLFFDVGVNGTDLEALYEVAVTFFDEPVPTEAPVSSAPTQTSAPSLLETHSPTETPVNDALSPTPSASPPTETSPPQDTSAPTEATSSPTARSRGIILLTTSAQNRLCLLCTVGLWLLM